jgi:hypothetical protein
MTDTSPTPTAELSTEEAQALTESIRENQENLWDLVIQAYRRHAWKALGYPDWHAYCKAEFGKIAVPQKDQGTVFAFMNEVGMSWREIAAATGKAHTTVGRNLRGGGANAPRKQRSKTVPITERAQTLATDLKKISTRVLKLQADHQFGKKSEEVRIALYDEAKHLVDILVNLDPTLSEGIV